MAGKTPMKKTRVSEISGRSSLGQTERREDPLSNYVVLQNIFSHLDNTDIESCCQVNECWNSVTDPLFLRYYDVRLHRNYESAIGQYSLKHGVSVFISPQPRPFTTGVDEIASISLKTHAYFPHCLLVTISKPSTYDVRVADEFQTTITDATKFLEAASRVKNIAINCDISSHDENEEAIAYLLTKFGKFVTKLSVGYGMTSRRLCEMLPSFFPNIRILDLSQAAFQEPDDLVFDGNVLGNGMKHLSMIGEFNSISPPKSQTWVNIFRMAPNLKEIPVFPIIGADALIQTGKGHCVKSLSYSRSMSHSMREFQSSLEKLANLELKLKTFNFRTFASPPNPLCNPLNQPFVRQILESSRGSLESLELHETEAFDFQANSPLNALKTVKFWLNKPTDTDQDFATNFLSSDTILSNVFPNVSNVQILPPLRNYSDSHLAGWFPESQFAPWGVRQLEFVGASLNTLQILGRAFPAVTALELRMEKGGLQRLFRAIGETWPEIESLIIKIPNIWEYWASRKGWNFESIFTGNANKDLNSYLVATDPLGSDTLFLSKEQEHLEALSPPRKLCKLKILTFDLNDGYEWGEKLKQSLENTSLVSEEFGLLFPPELEIVVRTNPTESCENSRRVLDVNPHLDHTVNFKFELR